MFGSSFDRWLTTDPREPSAAEEALEESLTAEVADLLIKHNAVVPPEVLEEAVARAMMLVVEYQPEVGMDPEPGEQSMGDTEPPDEHLQTWEKLLLEPVMTEVPPQYRAVLVSALTIACDRDQKVRGKGKIPLFSDEARDIAEEMLHLGSTGTRLFYEVR